MTDDTRAPLTERRWDELRRAIAELDGNDPETWPEHGNAPLAIAAGYALLKSENERLREELRRGKEIQKVRFPGDD